MTRFVVWAPFDLCCSCWRLLGGGEDVGRSGADTRREDVTEIGACVSRDCRWMPTTSLILFVMVVVLISCER